MIGRKEWPQYGVLKHRTVMPCSPREWADMMEFSNRKIARTEIENAFVSTVFLGLNHGFGEHPLWFETMVFDLVTLGNQPGPNFMRRYELYAQAERGHEEVCEEVRAYIHNMREAQRALLVGEKERARTGDGAGAEIRGNNDTSKRSID